MQSPTEDKFARGHTMATKAIVATLARALINKGVFSEPEVRRMLEDIRDMFSQPMATDVQLMARETGQDVLDNLFPPPP